MTSFQTAREAKEFLIAAIVEEAQRENVVLSEAERKMLYYSESGWTLPDMEAVSAEFDSCYEQDDYEAKIAKLIRNAGNRLRKQSPADYDIWWKAIRRLDAEDHYLTVMIRQAGLRPRGDLLRLWGTGVALVTAFLVLLSLSFKFGIDLDKYLPSRGTVTVYMWASLCVAVILYQLFRFFLGAKRMEDWVSEALEKLVRLRAR